MKKVFLNCMLLLCALIVGSNAWATDLLSWTARSKADGADTYTSGYTYATNKISGKAGYVQDSGTKDETIVSIALYHKTSKLFSTTPGQITLTAKLGGGSAKNPLDYNICACFVDNTGADISGSEVNITNKITTTTGSDISVSLPVAYSTNAYGVKIYHMKEDGWNARYYNFTLSYTAQVDATWSLAPATGVVTVGESTEITLTTNYDGTLTFESEDEDIATVSYNSSTKKITINGIAIGSTTINISGDATATYNAIDETLDVVVKKVLAKNCVMYESFDTNNQTGGNDGTWSNISTTPTPDFDLTGWTYATAYAASSCVRTGKGGYITSPAIGVSGNITLNFKMGSWGTDTNNGYVDILNGGTFKGGTATQKTVSINKGSWTNISLEIENVTPLTKIKFSDNGNNKRLFIDEVEVLVDKYKVSVSDVEWASLFLPFNVIVPAEATAYYASSVDDNAITLAEIPLTSTQHIIPANTGVLINADEGNYLFEYTATNPTAVSSEFDGVVTATTVESLSVPSGSSCYVLGANSGIVGFYLFSGTLAAYKAYLVTTTVSNAPGMRFIIEENNGATDINNVTSAEKAVKFIENGKLYILRDGVVYDLTGRMVR